MFSVKVLVIFGYTLFVLIVVQDLLLHSLTEIQKPYPFIKNPFCVSCIVLLLKTN